MSTYYAMSIPEIIVLMFVIFLWILSIFCCFKRYEKSLSTIERADMPSTYKQNLLPNPNSCSQTDSSTSSDDTTNKVNIHTDNITLTNTNSNTNNNMSNNTNITESTNTLVAYHQNKCFTTVNLSNQFNNNNNTHEITNSNINMGVSLENLNNLSSHKSYNHDSLFNIHSNNLSNLIHKNYSNVDVFNHENEMLPHAPIKPAGVSNGSKSQYKYEFISYEKKHPMHNLHKFSIKQPSRSSSTSTQNNINQFSFHTSLIGNLPNIENNNNNNNNTSQLEIMHNSNISNSNIIGSNLVNNNNNSKLNKLIYLHNQFKNTRMQASLMSSKNEADLEQAKHKLILLNLPEYQSNMFSKINMGSSQNSFRKSDLDMKKAKSEPMLTDLAFVNEFNKKFEIYSMMRDKDKDSSILRSISIDINNRHSLNDSNSLIANKDEIGKDLKFLNKNTDSTLASNKTNSLTRNKQHDNTQSTLHTADSITSSIHSRHLKRQTTHGQHDNVVKLRKNPTLSIPSNEENELLNPDLIPRFIKKSLIDLHKKSMWNLAHKSTGAAPTNSTQLNASLHMSGSHHLTANPNTINILSRPLASNNPSNHSSSNNLLAKLHHHHSHHYHHHHHHNQNTKQLNENHLIVSDTYPYSQSNTSTTSVYTQPKNKNEIKMKIMENYV